MCLLWRFVSALIIANAGRGREGKSTQPNWEPKPMVNLVFGDEGEDIKIDPEALGWDQIALHGPDGRRRRWPRLLYEFLACPVLPAWDTFHIIYTPLSHTDSKPPRILGAVERKLATLAVWHGSERLSTHFGSLACPGSGCTKDRNSYPFWCLWILKPKHKLFLSDHFSHTH